MAILCIAVFLPMAAGLLGLALPFPTEGARRWYHCGLIAATAALAWVAVLRLGGDAYTLFRFSPGLAFAFRLDEAGRLFAALVATLWPFTTVYALDYMDHEGNPAVFWGFFTAAFGITLGIAFAANLLTMYVFYELLTLATIPLVMHAMTRTAIQAGIRYMVYAMSGAALGFIGLVYLLRAGAQDFVAGGHGALLAGGGTLLTAVFALSFVGFAVKAAIWPLHGWLPAAAVAPTPVTALLHAVAVVKAGAFACLRLTWYCFGPDVLRGTWAQYAVMALAAVTVLYGSGMALKERHFKRRLAYSTIANLSYILFAVTLMTEEGMAAALLHLVAHSVAKIMAFFCAGAVLHYGHREQVAELEGLGRAMPVTFGCFAVAAFALTGIPPFNGFVSKWYIGLAAVHAGGALALAGFGAVLLSALLTAIYLFQIVIAAFFPQVDHPLPEGAREAPWQMLVPMVLLAALCLAMGLLPGGLLGFIREAVAV